ncbi:MAG: ABC transporter permease [Oscillospiraceae bacterium]|nr:ABC transporter permease [Oscillospiraceae bacterium]
MLLLKKAARTVWRAKKAYIACIVLMSIGIMMYFSFNMLYLNLQTAMEQVYREQRFGDGFAQVVSMPSGQVGRLEGIPGIEKASGTLTLDVRAEIEGFTRTVTLRLVSFDSEEEDRLNDVFLESGALPGPEEMLVNSTFAAAHGFSHGDQLEIILNGQRITLTISGTGQSPDAILVMRDPADLVPDPETFGIAFIPAGQLTAMAGRTGEVNALSFRLEDGVDWREVEHPLEDALSAHGLIYLIPRKDQFSHLMLDAEITAIGGMANSVPMVFILMAVTILYIMLKRVIEQERGQIGILKAFGFSDRALIMHYLGYGMIVGFLGGIIGIFSGVALSGYYTDLIVSFYNLPSMRADISLQYLAIAMAIALGSGALGSLMGARSMLDLRPCEAMRPPAPPLVKGDLLAKLPFLRYFLSSYGFMALRSISRNKMRSAFIVMGISFSFAIIAFMTSYMEMFGDLLDARFTQSQVFDMRISMNTPQSYTPLMESGFRLEGAQGVEAILELPVLLSHGHLNTGALLTGMREDGHLYRIYDVERNTHLRPSRGGVILSSVAANELNAVRGSVLLMDAPSAGREEISLPVLDIVSENFGAAVYIELESLWEILDVPPTANTLLLQTDQAMDIINALRYNDTIASMTEQAQVRQHTETMLESNGAMFLFMQLAGIAIAYAIITNTASISLSERKREYATLRVLGMQPKEVCEIMSFEYWVLLILGMIPGIPLVYLMKLGLNDMMGSADMSLPLDTSVTSYLTAGVLCALAVFISNLSARRRIATFDMVDVLKERE